MSDPWNPSLDPAPRARKSAVLVPNSLTTPLPWMQFEVSNVPDGPPILDVPNLTDSLAVKRDQLLALLATLGRVAVAYSGGVDSAVVAKAALLALGENAVAVTAVSDSLASGELENARSEAVRIGIRHEIIQTGEFKQPGYVANAPDRCFYCKTELYSTLAKHHQSLHFDTIVNGANADDQDDHRPGMRAADDHAVRSPLLEVGLNKAEVRELAHHWGLRVWDKPASPCLASRLAYGVQVTPERVERIDRAEHYLRTTFGLAEFRVRLESNDLARIEVPLQALPALATDPARQQLVAHFRGLGFRYITVDLEGFRSGSLNQVIPIESLIRHGATSPPTPSSSTASAPGAANRKSPPSVIELDK